MSIRVGFIFEKLDSQWMGGLNYFINLLRAIHEMPNKPIETVIFTGLNVNLFGMENYAQVVRSQYLDKNTLQRNFRKILQRIIKKDIILYNLATKHKIDCFSHASNLWKNCPIPSIPWIADFQHKRLPELFEETEIQRRNKEHARLLKLNYPVLLSSHSAAKDCELFYPGNGADIKVLQFVSTVSPNWLPESKFTLIEKYNLPDEWFHVPNQYWTHKNHRIVIEALHILKSQDSKAFVISTGNTVNHRSPNQFSSLTKLINEFDLNSSYLILGPIPYNDMISLMYHSIAVINPSFFEGWSTTVEESKSLGKKILLSNIDVHVEQSPSRAHYFNPNNAYELADLIKQSLIKYSQEEETHQLELAKNETALRQIKFTEIYQNIIVSLLNNK